MNILTGNNLSNIDFLEIGLALKYMFWNAIGRMPNLDGS